MCEYLEKYCPRCNAAFECRQGNIGQCQCFGITFNDEEQQLFNEKFTDCLCINCLIEIKNEFAEQRKQLPLQKIIVNV